MLEIQIELKPVKPPEGLPLAFQLRRPLRLARRDGCATAWNPGTGTLTSHTRPESPDYLDIRERGPRKRASPRQAEHGDFPPRVCHSTSVTARACSMSCSFAQVKRRRSSTWGSASIASNQHKPPWAGQPRRRGSDNARPTARGQHGLAFPPRCKPTSCCRVFGRHPTASTEWWPRLLEISGPGVFAGFRCVRNPVRAVVEDVYGTGLIDVNIEGDTVQVEVGGNGHGSVANRVRLGMALPAARLEAKTAIPLATSVAPQKTPFIRCFLFTRIAIRWPSERAWERVMVKGVWFRSRDRAPDTQEHERAGTMKKSCWR